MHFLIVAFILNSVANVILKIGSQKGLSLEGGFISLLMNHWLTLLGLFIFGLNVVFYFLALRSVPLSTAYPIMSIMSFMLINGYAILGLGEHISVGQIVGYVFLITGIIFVFYFSEATVSV